MSQRITDAPIGYLTRFKSQVEDAEKCFPGEPHDYLLTYTHGTKDMERFAAFPDIEVVPVYATPKPAKGLTVQADADGVWLAFAASTGLHALLNVERIADSHGGIVSKAIRDWAADVSAAACPSGKCTDPARDCFGSGCLGPNK